MPFLGDAAASGLGKIEKAILVIHEFGNAAEMDSKKTADQTRKILQATDSAGKTVQMMMKDHVIRVQYNPGSLMIQANAEPIPFTYMQQNIDSGVPNQNLRPPMVVLSVELLFDAMNPADAFMMDKLRLSGGQAVSTASAAVNAAKGRSYTVQPQTNGLVATLMRPGTRFVTFNWGDMCFTGQVIEVQAEYTMFSPSGRPIRSAVRMNIAQQVESKADTSRWDSLLDEVFDENGRADWKNAGQKIGNLLNLGAF